MTREEAPHGAANGDESWESLLAAMEARIVRIGTDVRNVFETDAADLFAVFLSGIPADQQPVHTCTSCRRFVERYGSLVVISESGETAPLLWDPELTLAPYREPVREMARRVAASRVTGPFVSVDEVWGRVETGGWTHFSVRPPTSLVRARSLLPTETPRQIAAAKRHEQETLLAGLEAYPHALVQRAHALLTTGALFRSEKCIGVAEWLSQLHATLQATPHERRRENVIWRASASAPPGFCHVRSGMIGTLLDDLAADLPFEEVKAKFDAKMHPLQYMRPTAAPTAGNIAQAEKMMAALRAEGSLARRFARLEDVQALWTPRRPARRGKKAGVFSHLLQRDDARGKDTGTPPVVITWEKFARTVLPSAEQIHMLVPTTPASFAAMVTASDPAAPPILQWDTLERRNPVSFYLYLNGSPAARWNLVAGAYRRVTAITLGPSAWATGQAPRHQGKQAFLLLEGARDTKHEAGGGFFPESLKSELHPIRSTLEAYAKQAKIEGAEQATACGYMLQEGVAWDCLVRVTGAAGLRTTYRLDRWD